MFENQTILVVDDDPIQRLLIADALGGRYNLMEAESGEAALACVSSVMPVLVLLDIGMGPMDGFEVCRVLKMQEAMADVPVVFVSARQALEDRLAAYEAGGEDFIAKPVEPEELRAKVAVTLNKVAERQRLEGGAREAMQVAMSAMSSVSELGSVVNAMRALFAAQDEAGMAQAMLAACAEYGLEACVRLVTVRGVLMRSQHGDTTAVESGVLDMLSQGDRIARLGRQAAFHYGGVTLLVKNMPVDDPDLAGRLRDHLAMIAECGEMRVRMLDADLALAARNQAHFRLYRQSVDALNGIYQRHEAHKSETALVLENMLTEVEVAFPSLGLTVGQEEAVMALLRGAAERISHLYADGLQIDDHLTLLDQEAGVRG